MDQDLQIDYPFRDERHYQAAAIVKEKTGLDVRIVPGTDKNVTAEEMADEVIATLVKAFSNADDWALDELD